MSLDVAVDRRPTRRVLVLVYATPVVLFVVSFGLGRFAVDPVTVVRILTSRVLPIHQTWSAAEESVVLDIRLPRIALAMCIGAGLSISGASFQGIFRNPLVSPDLLGVSAAAGFGAALAIVLSGSTGLINVLAFAFGVSAVVVTYLMSRVQRTTPVIMLVLSGIIVASFFSSLISVMTYVADPQKELPAITFWLLGSLSSATPSRLAVAGPLILAGIVGLVAVRWRINVIALGDDEARALGARAELIKGVVIVCVTVITAAAVAVAGIIGWVGLVIPHATRILVGPDHRKLLPATLAVGASYLLLIDDLSRTIASAEVPIGILTALIGAPVFAILIRRQRGRW